MSQRQLKAIIVVFGVGAIILLVMFIGLLQQRENEARQQVRDSICAERYVRGSAEWANCVKGQ